MYDRGSSYSAGGGGGVEDVAEGVAVVHPAGAVAGKEVVGEAGADYEVGVGTVQERPVVAVGGMSDALVQLHGCCVRVERWAFLSVAGALSRSRGCAGRVGAVGGNRKGRV